jgi:choloylglycine hydrolase
MIMLRVLFLFFAFNIYACTDFLVLAKDGSCVNGRSLEFALEMQSQLKITPRQHRIQSLAPGQQKGMHWVSKYGYLGVTALGMDFSFDGMNEKGLSFGYLWLPGVTQYPTVPAQEMNQALDFIDLGDWILGNFSSIQELKEALKTVRIWAHPVPQLGLPPVHAAIHDAEGKSLVIEFVAGEMKVYDNPIGILTNSPPFDWQIANLSNYLNLKPEGPNSVAFRGVELVSPGQGSGFLGLPGDWSPPSRFVKIATYLRFVKPVVNGIEAVNLAEHLLNSVDIPLGTVRDPGKDSGDYTQWIVIKDLKQRVFYFRSYQDLALKMIDLKKLRFDREMKNSLPLNTKKGYFDVTSSLQ